jgi:hypothetical protein
MPRKADIILDDRKPVELIFDNHFIRISKKTVDSCQNSCIIQLLGALPIIFNSENN